MPKSITMLTLKTPDACCGCGACAEVCATKCITMKPDAEGFLYPTVDASRCTDCGLCNRVCPMQHPGEERQPTHVYVAKARDEETRRKSSSGGLFSLLARHTFAENGVVFGARFDKQWQVVMDEATCEEQLQPLLGSKYVQAVTGDAFTRVRKYLLAGRKVLFCGTPCQVRALKLFLHRSYDELLTTVEVLCHGVPSPLVWQMYLEQGGHQYASVINFRDKQNGWRNYRLSIDPTDKKTPTYLSPVSEDSYMQGFVRDLTLRPSCYKCRFQEGRSSCDLALGDCWGVGLIRPEFDDDKGVSTALTYTKVGEAAYPANGIETFEAPLELATAFNAGYKSELACPPERAAFFAALPDASDIRSLIEEHLPATPVYTAPSLPKKESKLKRLLHKLGFGHRRKP